jgi:hypothetical protein
VAKKHHQEFIGLYHQHLQDENVELQEHHQPVRVTSRLPQSDDSSGTIPSMDSRNTFFTHSASVFDAGQIDWECTIEFPSEDENLERNNLSKSQWNAFRAPQSIDQTISSRQSTT